MRFSVGAVGMETAGTAVATAAAAGASPAADITLTAGIVLDTDMGRRDGDGAGRTATGGWLAGGATSRTDGLDDIAPYDSKTNNNIQVCK